MTRKSTVRGSLRIAIVTGILAAAMAAAGGTASAATPLYPDVYQNWGGSGSCYDPSWGGLGIGSAGGPTITSPPITLTNRANVAVTFRAFVAVIDGNGVLRSNWVWDGDRSVGVGYTTTSAFQPVTLNVNRTVSDYFFARVRILIETYVYTPNGLGQYLGNTYGTIGSYAKTNNYGTVIANGVAQC